jgi:hypothetical protein
VAGTIVVHDHGCDAARWVGRVAERDDVGLRPEACVVVSEEPAPPPAHASKREHDKPFANSQSIPVEYMWVCACEGVRVGGCVRVHGWVRVCVCGGGGGGIRKISMNRLGL